MSAPATRSRPGSGRRADWLQVVVATAVLVVVNALASYVPGRVDLTEEKRFTLTPATERTLRELDEPVYVEVLLDGEFPAGFARLRTATEEMLRDLSGVNGELDYGFTDPGAGTLEEVNTVRKQLVERGLKPVNFAVQSAEGRSERLLWPYAIVNYAGRRQVVNLLENNVPGQRPDVAVNNSVSLLEYKFANAIQKLLRNERPLIAFTSGHGELSPLQTRDLTNALAPYYDIERINLDTFFSVGPEEIGAIVVADPRTPFSDRAKFVLDQYVMRGGRLLVMLDKLSVNLDSLQGRPEFIPNDQTQNLDDLLFEYGVRVEPNLVLDLQSTRVPVVTGQVGNAPQFELRPWPYHVLATPAPRHPVTRSLQPVQLYFPSELDTTVRTRLPIRKTALLTTTANALVRYSPARVSLEDVRYGLERDRFDKGPLPLAVLLEGRFTSLYENRVGTAFARGLAEIGQDFRAEGEPARVIVVGDGDLAKNAIDPAQGAFRPLGYNDFEKYVFDNRDFLVNAIEYLFDEGGVIAARNREVKLRLLDGPRAQAEATRWRLLNIGAPLVLLTLAGVGYRAWRRRRYAYAPPTATPAQP